jgi:aryl-alcohol dehydrogenase-like predicted oxidoreductase
MKLVIGTAQFGMKYGLKKKKIKDNEFKKIKSFLIKSKINKIDTAQSYGNSEKVLGDYYFKNFKFISKINIPKIKNNDIFNWLSNEVDISLKKLQTKTLYGLLIHDYKDLKGKKGILYINALKKLKKKGLVKKIGISIYNPNELNSVVKVFKPDIVQFPYNVLDQRIVTSGWLNKLKKLKIETYARSCFLQGLLLNFQKINRIKDNFKSFEKTLNKWFSWCVNNNISPIKASLDFVRAQQKIDYLIVGFDNVNELRDLKKNFSTKKVFVPNIFTSNNINLIDPRKWYK